MASGGLTPPAARPQSKAKATRRKRSAFDVFVGGWHCLGGAYATPLAGGDVPPAAAPARAEDLSGLAPAFLGIGDVDAFVDENLDYVARLGHAGVPTELHVYPGVIHGGFGAPPSTPRTAQFLRDIYAALASAFAAPT